MFRVWVSGGWRMERRKVNQTIGEKYGSRNQECEGEVAKENEEEPDSYDGLDPMSRGPILAGWSRG